jgi:hypothetical protein
MNYISVYEGYRRPHEIRAAYEQCDHGFQSPTKLRMRYSDLRESVNMDLMWKCAIDVRDFPGALIRHRRKSTEVKITAQWAAISERTTSAQKSAK